MTTRSLLADLHAFSGCSPAAMDALESLAREGTLEPDEILFEEGDPSSAAFVLASGTVRIQRRLLIGGERTLAVLPPGTLFGEAAIIDRSERTATAAGETLCRLVALPRDPMRAWIAAHPQEGIRFLGHLGHQMMGRIRAANELLRETVEWGLEISGAMKLGLDQLIHERATLSVGLASGRRITGRLVRVDAEDGRDQRLWIADPDGKVHLVPYHAVEELVADVDLAARATATAADSGEA